jgi:HPt (histidine-containing phosphotransfer) domain-containing protein
MQEILTSAPGDRACANLAARPSDVAADDRAALLLDRVYIDEIRHIERVTGRDDIFSGSVRALENDLACFGADFSDFIAFGNSADAELAAHTLRGASHQLGAKALGDLFAEIEHSVKAGDFAEAKRKFDGGAVLIAQSLEALKRA